MAKVKLDYMSLSMRAEGSDDMVRELSGRFLDMADKYAAPGFYFPALPPSVFEDGCRDPEELNTGDMKPLTTPKEVAPGADWDVVAIYDDAGIPSIMHRFRRMSNKELFGGSDKPHPAFIIGGEVYDEIYISVYPNVMINGKPYSLPFQKPAGNITLDDFSKACFSKGEGWHPMTAAEWGFLANLSLKLGTLPHGNTDYGAWHGDHKEHGQKAPNSNRTLTGTGPETWTHDHTKTGVHDLCGNIWEVLAGLRIKNGVLMVAANNDAALPETDLTQCGDDWKLLTDDKGAPVYVSASGSKIVFTTDNDEAGGVGSSEWGKVKTECKSEMLKEYALFAGEEEAYCYIDATEGEYIPFRGGNWYSGESAGVFGLYLSLPRSSSWASTGAVPLSSRRSRKLNAERLMGCAVAQPKAGRENADLFCRVLYHGVCVGPIVGFVRHSGLPDLLFCRVGI